MPTSRQDPARAEAQRRLHPPQEDAKEWLPLWLAGPVVALVAILGLIGLCMMAAEAYTWLL